MKFLVVLFAAACVALAESRFAGHGYATLPEAYGFRPVFSRSGFAAVESPIVPIPAALGITSQYHTQDEFGQASYGHSEPHQTHNAIQDARGNKIGSFSYVAPDGRVIRTDYVADALGYRVTSNALPISPTPVSDTPEVAAARAAHLAHHYENHLRTKRGIAEGFTTPASNSFLRSGIPLTSPTRISHSITAAGYNAPPPLIYTPLSYSYFR